MKSAEYQAAFLRGEIDQSDSNERIPVAHLDELSSLPKARDPSYSYDRPYKINGFDHFFHSRGFEEIGYAENIGESATEQSDQQVSHGITGNVSVQQSESVKSGQLESIVCNLIEGNTGNDNGHQREASNTSRDSSHNVVYERNQTEKPFDKQGSNSAGESSDHRDRDQSNEPKTSEPTMRAENIESMSKEERERLIKKLDRALRRIRGYKGHDIAFLRELLVENIETLGDSESPARISSLTPIECELKDPTLKLEQNRDGLVKRNLSSLGERSSRC